MSAVTTNVTYAVFPKDGSKLFYTITSEPGKKTRSDKNFTTEDYQVEIENVRGKEEKFTLDKNGFQFFRRATKHTDFTDDERIRQEYYPESEELLKELTGASRVLFFDHTVRRRVAPENTDAIAQQDASGIRQPAPQAHVDQSTAGAIARVHRHLPPADAEAALRRRFQIINLWRPVKHAALDWPLAFCDYQSVDVEGGDVTPTELRRSDYTGETMAIKYNPQHKWKYLRAMEPDEFVLIKCYDSKDGVAKFVPHTAFKDPSTPPEAPLRESIELRALVFYD